METHDERRLWRLAPAGGAGALQVTELLDRPLTRTMLDSRCTFLLATSDELWIWSEHRHARRSAQRALYAASFLQGSAGRWDTSPAEWPVASPTSRAICAWHVPEAAIAPGIVTIEAAEQLERSRRRRQWPTSIGFGVSSSSSSPTSPRTPVGTACTGGALRRRAPRAAWRVSDGELGPCPAQSTAYSTPQTRTCCD